jgi:hypothetical protein
MKHNKQEIRYLKILHKNAFMNWLQRKDVRFFIHFKLNHNLVLLYKDYYEGVPEAEIPLVEALYKMSP